MGDNERIEQSQHEVGSIGTAASTNCLCYQLVILEFSGPRGEAHGICTGSCIWIVEFDTSPSIFALATDLSATYPANCRIQPVDLAEI